MLNFIRKLFGTGITHGISSGKQIKERGNDMSQIISAAKIGDTNTILTLLNKGANVDEKDEYGETALMHAAYNGHNKTVKLLVEYGAKIDIKDNNNQTALHFAALNGHKEIVDILINKGADINAKESNYGQTPLFLATKNGHEKIVLQLLNLKGIEVNEPGTTPLIAAANKGYIGIVKALLGKGSDINAVDQDGKTALMHAANCGHIKLVELLLENGANINMKDGRGFDPFDFAIMGGHDEIAMLLKSRKGTSTTQKDNAGDVYKLHGQREEKGNLSLKTEYYKVSAKPCCGNCYRFFIGLNQIDGYCSNPLVPSNPMKVDPDDKCTKWERRTNW